MPTDVSIEIAVREPERQTLERLPIGLGLGIGALAHLIASDIALSWTLARGLVTVATKG
jgi:hypothetical protein